jgi:sugar phosphate permease
MIITLRRVYLIDAMTSHILSLPVTFRNRDEELPTGLDSITSMLSFDMSVRDNIEQNEQTRQTMPEIVTSKVFTKNNKRVRS